MITPSAVLFNGGVFKAAELRAAGRSRSSPPGPASPSRRCEAADLDLAVALGAAYYGQVRRGKGVRIRGGVAAVVLRRHRDRRARPSRASPPPIKALCVVPMGMEEGTETDVPGPEFGLVVGEPAEFRFLGSTTRRDDPVGTVLDRWAPEELQELAPLETAPGRRGRRRRARPSRSGSTRTSPRSARSSSGATAPATTAAGSWNSTSASRRETDEARRLP